MSEREIVTALHDVRDRLLTAVRALEFGQHHAAEQELADAASTLRALIAKLRDPDDGRKAA